ncbi:MAG: TRAP transporter substrate-binding protein DctP [Alphaproteobacteria bacterium]|nr:TRAP transporter substrate-binding protein DctP [Alphaproteobacteria bacterium]
MPISTVRALAGAGAVAAGLALTAPADAQTLWKGYTFIPSVTHAAFKNLEAMGAEFAKVSGGRIQVRSSAGGQLPVNATSITQAVGEGIITYAQDGFYTGNIQIGALPFLPMLAGSYEDFRKIVDLLRPYLDRELDKRGVKLLATYNFPQQTIWWTSDLTGIEQLQGRKLRVANNPQAQFFQQLGAIPVTLGSPEVASALQRGVVDGVITASAGGGLLWGDMFKSNYRVTICWDNFLIIVNKEAFEKLPADVQPKIVAAAQQHAEALSKELAESEVTSTEMLKGKGIKFHMPTDDVVKAMTARAEPVWNDWAKGVGPQAVEALAKARQAIGR